MNKVKRCGRGHWMARHRRFHPNGDSYCSKCKAERYTKFRRNNPERTRAYQQRSKRRRYGLEPKDFDALLKRQGGVCAVCKSTEWGIRGPHIDHCHDRGVIRGILCHRCNTALGLLKDDQGRIRSALRYLKKYNGDL